MAMNPLQLASLVALAAGGALNLSALHNALAFGVAREVLLGRVIAHAIEAGRILDVAT